MTWLSLGSMALPFQLKTQGVQMRAEIARLGTELTTGLVSAPARHLKGDTGPLAAIIDGLLRNETYLQNTRTSAIRSDIAQNALSAVESARSGTAQTVLRAVSAWTPGETGTTIGAAARAALADTVAALSARSGGVALFSGVASDSVPLVSADEMIDALAPMVAGHASATDIANAVAAQFLEPGGLFDTDFYRGGATGPGGVIGTGVTADPLPTAADRSVRVLLAGLATAALLADPPSTLPRAGRHVLAERAADLLMSSAGGLAAMQADVGALQATLETRQTRLLAERDTLSTARLSLIAADPYEVATRLQDTQTRLDALYTLTARTARLSLTEYLR